ncbi:heavy-metal-associated domain-containing protein [Chelativorans sp. M5D2P16]|uniref:heavy-metal-associated domain-containing protein n=1 Tax=Chelativorans sp. M5D2P16 TaxID=3095678 RepID=UPI002ACA953C|nr:cation transporter [Chelativorans sp. M5D2P16]MDZ5697089.1 cation transporter [Chelativorans sp. M5D2P16]
MKPTRAIATGFLALAVSAMSFIAPVPSPFPASVAHAAETEHVATFDVPGMTCALCPVTVRKAMESVAGVISVEVNFDAKTTTVVFDPSMTTIEAIAAASANAGYPAHISGS